jgi:hypothetical protein
VADWEESTSYVQSNVFSWLASDMTYEIGPGPSPQIFFPPSLGALPAEGAARAASGAHGRACAVAPPPRYIVFRLAPARGLGRWPASPGGSRRRI